MDRNGISDSGQIDDATAKNKQNSNSISVKVDEAGNNRKHSMVSDSVERSDSDTSPLRRQTILKQVHSSDILPDNHRESGITEKKTRRQTLKAIAGGVGIATVLSPTIVGKVKAEQNAIGLKEVGIRDQYLKLHEQGKVEQAESLLQKYNIKYERATVPVGPRQQQSSDGASTLKYDKSACRISLYSSLNYGNYWTTVLDAILHTDGTAGGRRDGMGISFAADRWAYEPGTASTPQYVSHFDDDPEGVLAEFDDVKAWLNDQPPRNEQYTYFSVDLEKLEPGQHNLYGHYGHTWCPIACGGGVSFGIQLGLFSVEVSTGVKYWKKPSPTIEV